MLEFLERTRAEEQAQVAKSVAQSAVPHPPAASIITSTRRRLATQLSCIPNDFRPPAVCCLVSVIVCEYDCDVSDYPHMLQRVMWRIECEMSVDRAVLGRSQVLDSTDTCSSKTVSGEEWYELMSNRWRWRLT